MLIDQPKMNVIDIINEYKAADQPYSPTSELKPFDSPIEKELYRVISKYLAVETNISNQNEFVTPNGNYRVDFLLQSGDRKVVLEANGKEFHDDGTDIYRGAFILGFSDVSSVFYIRGCDITYSLPTVLYAISQHEPLLFSERGLKSLEALSEVKKGRGEIDHSDILCTETGIKPTSSEFNEYPIAYSLIFLKKDGENNKWKRIYKAALDSPGVSAKDFDEVFITSPHYFIKKRAMNTQ